MATLEAPTKSQLEELMTFPCSFCIKVMGVNTPELISEVIAIVSINSDGFDPERDIVTKPSSKGNYLSVNATITATSKAQLDTIYLALNKHPLVKITL